MANTYVGGKTAGSAGQGGGSIAINSGLAGGSGGAPIQGDLVVVTVSVGTAARTPAIAIVTPAGYTPLSVQRYTAQTYDANVQTCYKFMGASPDTAVTIPASGSTQDGIAYAIQVFRGVDLTTPLDGVTPTYATGAGTSCPDPAAIQPATTGAWIVVCGGGAAAAGANYTAAYLTNLLTSNGPDNNDGTVGAGYYTGWSSGSYNPAAFGGGSVNAINSWGCTTLALRPAAEAHSGAGTMSAATGETNAGNKQGSGLGTIAATIGMVGLGLAALAGVGAASVSVSMVATGVASSAEEHSGAGATSAAHSMDAVGKMGGQGAGSASNATSAVATGKMGGQGAGSASNATSAVGVGAKTGKDAGVVSASSATVASGAGGRKDAGSVSASTQPTATGQKGAAGVGAASASVTMDASGSPNQAEEHSGAGSLSEPTSLSATGSKNAEGAGGMASSVSMVATGEQSVAPVAPPVSASDVWVALPPTIKSIAGTPSRPRRWRLGESGWWY